MYRFLESLTGLANHPQVTTMGDSRMSIAEKSPERFYRFSAYDSNEAKRRMRSLHRKAQSNEEVMEPEALREKAWRDRFAAFQLGVTRRVAAPRVTTTVARPFFSLVLMSCSIVTGLFPLHLVGRAVRRSIRRFRSSFIKRSSKTFREYGVQTEDYAIEEISERRDCQRDERAPRQCQPH
ncbi:hypothetical protein TSMEX_006886 [Taenia solium]|eukprot:TsM_000497400 transcript=TsM_000497400 gene=TsM_000497400